MLEKGKEGTPSVWTGQPLLLLFVRSFQLVVFKQCA